MWELEWSCADDGGGLSKVSYHIANVLSATPQCVCLSFIVDADQERFLANVASVVLGVLAVGELLDMGLLAVWMVLLLGLLGLLLVLLVLLRLVPPVRILPGIHLGNL